MTIEIVRDIFGWCAVINIGFIGFWGLMFALVPDFVYNIHSKVFRIEKDEFIRIHYIGIAFYKLLTFVLCLVPYLAMRIVG